MCFEPPVSLIVPVYNGASTLARCLESLRSLVYAHNRLEIIVVDNASTDQTPAILKNHADRIRIVQESTRGRSAACNAGIRNARSEIIAITDADCILDPGWLRSLIQPLQDLDVGLVGGKILAARPDSLIQKFGEIIHDNESAVHQRFPSVIGMSWACRKLVIEQVHGFDEAFLRVQDSDLAFRISQAGYRLVYEPNAVLYHENEETYWGLYQEGYKHGHWSVLWFKKHAEAVRKDSRGRFPLSAYRQLIQAFVMSFSLRAEQRTQARCQFAFNLGKRIGKMTGSFKFGYLEL